MEWEIANKDTINIQEGPDNMKQWTETSKMDFKCKVMYLGNKKIKERHEYKTGNTILDSRTCRKALNILVDRS